MQVDATVCVSHERKNDQLGLFCISLYENRKIEPTQPHTTYTQVCEAPMKGGDGTLINENFETRAQAKVAESKPETP